MNNTDEGMKTMTTTPPRRGPLSKRPAISLTKSEDAQFLAWSMNFNRAQKEAMVARTHGCSIELNFISTSEDHDRDCEGHESLRGDRMGMVDYCDGSCRPAWTPLIRR